MAKTNIPKEGIFIFKNSRGFGFRFKQNKFILATAGGYDTKQAAKKGIRAIARMCKSNFLILEKDLPVVDLTKLAKRKPKTFIALAGKYKGQKVTERATPVELKTRKDSRWITNPDGSPGTSLKAHLKPVKSTTKSGKR